MLKNGRNTPLSLAADNEIDKNRVRRWGNDAGLHPYPILTQSLPKIGNFRLSPIKAAWLKASNDKTL